MTDYGAIYDEMIDRNTRIVDTARFKPDVRLIEPVDDRRCVAIYSPIKVTKWHPGYEGLRNVISDSAESMIPYTEEQDPTATPHGVLHTTLIQLHTFGSARVEDQISKDSQRTLDLLLSSSLPIHIEFSRLCITPASITALGFPSIDLNIIRERLRREIDVEEPYVCNIVHSTLARFHSIPDRKIIEELRTYDRIPLFTASINRWSVGKASWRLNSNECTVQFQIEKS